MATGMNTICTQYMAAITTTATTVVVKSASTLAS